MAVRGCGTRVHGGIYIEVTLAEGGSPLELFLVDPARELPEGLEIPNRGIAIHERIVMGKPTGVYDVYDRIGTNYYPNVADFLFETRQHGISRRVSANADFGKLTKQSRLILIHGRAIMENADDLYRAIDTEMREFTDAHSWYCPCRVEGHDDYPLYTRDSRDCMPTCVGAYNECVVGGTELLDPRYPNRTVKRTVGDTTYEARRTPLGVIPEYSEGIFMRIPISRIAVIADPDGHKDVPNAEKASQSGLPVVVEEE